MRQRTSARAVPHANTTKPKRSTAVEPTAVEPAPDAGPSVRYPDIPGVKPHLIRWLETEDLETYVGPPAEPPIEMPAPVASQPQPKPESAEPAQKPSRPHKETKKKEKRPPDRDRNHGQGSSPRSSKPRKVGTADSASLRRPSAEAFPSS